MWDSQIQQGRVVHAINRSTWNQRQEDHKFEDSLKNVSRGGKMPKIAAFRVIFKIVNFSIAAL